MHPPPSKTLRQIQITKSLYLKLKRHCINEETTLTQFYEDMLTWFIKARAKNKESNCLASHRDGKKLSLWLQPAHAKKVAIFAKKDNVSEARIIHTALIYYTSSIGLK